MPASLLRILRDDTLDDVLRPKSSSSSSTFYSRASQKAFLGHHKALIDCFVKGNTRVEARIYLNLLLRRWRSGWKTRQMSCESTVYHIQGGIFGA